MELCSLPNVRVHMCTWLGGDLIKFRVSNYLNLKDLISDLLELMFRDKIAFVFQSKSI